MGSTRSETMDAPGSNSGDAAAADTETSGVPRLGVPRSGVAPVPVGQSGEHVPQLSSRPSLLPAARRGHDLGGGADGVITDGLVARAAVPVPKSNDGRSGKRHRKPLERLVSSRISTPTRIGDGTGPRPSILPAQLSGTSGNTTTCTPAAAAAAGVGSGTVVETERSTVAVSRGGDMVVAGGNNDTDAPTILVKTPGPHDIVIGGGNEKYPGNLFLEKVMRVLLPIYKAMQQNCTAYARHPLILNVVGVVIDREGGHVLEKKGDRFAVAEKERIQLYDYISNAMDADKDLELWNKPCPPKDDCPLCMIPLPLNDEFTYWDCCGQTTCRACDLESRRARHMTNAEREEKELPPLEEVCPFCRAVAWKDDEISHASRKQRLEERGQNGDMEAAYMLGSNYLFGEHGLEINQERALGFIHQAANAGSTAALSILGRMCAWGDYGMVVNRQIGHVHFEKGARHGSADAHYCLGLVEEENGDVDLSIKHHAIAAEAGDSYSMEELWRYFYTGKLTKQKLEEILRRHQEAVGEMDSEERKRHRDYLRAKKENDEALEIVYRKYYQGKMSGKHLKRLLSLNLQ